MGLDLYSKVEPYLGFQDEVKKLHQLFFEIVDEINPKTLLDLGCGQGDFMLSLPKKIDMKGIDLSSEQILVCKEKKLNAECIDIKDLKESFEVITATFDVLNYVPQINIKTFIKNIYDRVEKGGYFVFDVNSQFAFEEIVTGAIVIDEKDKFITIDAEYEEPSLRTQITLFSKDNDNSFSKEQDHIVQYFHSKEFLKESLIKIGFDVEAIQEYYLYDFDEADKLIFICKKD